MREQTDETPFARSWAEGQALAMPEEVALALATTEGLLDLAAIGASEYMTGGATLGPRGV
jgi:hypothetical protein